MFIGDGGRGGDAGVMTSAVGAGGDGGVGGNAGKLSVLGVGGDGGSGVGVGDGGRGGDGSYVLGVGGNGGASGAGGTPGEAGNARVLFLFCRNGLRGVDNSLVYFLDDTSQTSNTPTGYGVIGEFNAGERATLTAEAGSSVNRWPW